VLLEHGAAPGLLNGSGLAALHLLCGCPPAAPRADVQSDPDDARRRLIQMLASYGADVDARTVGSAPVEVCRRAAGMSNFAAPPGPAAQTSAATSATSAAQTGRCAGAVRRATPLHCAVILRDLSAARALVEAGASLSAVDGSGRCALGMVLSQQLSDAELARCDARGHNPNAARRAGRPGRGPGGGGRSSNTKAAAKRLILAVARAPAWLHDDDAPACMSCAAPWTLRRRRHHCRHCGRVVCGPCSAHTLDLGALKPAAFGDESGEVRVCGLCFRALSFEPAAVARSRAGADPGFPAAARRTRSERRAAGAPVSTPTHRTNRPKAATAAPVRSRRRRRARSPAAPRFGATP
jgi:hypothetical protein